MVTLNKEQAISGDTVFTPTNNLVTSKLADELVILNMQSGVYYSLNGIGTEIWAMIENKKSVEDIQAAVLEVYKVEPERCERDLVELLVELLNKKLIVAE